ncbi:MAG: fasciclin domain-containing protein [Vulcanimicrobiaceae bacterium]
MLNRFTVLVAADVLGLAGPVGADTMAGSASMSSMHPDPMVGGAAMYLNKNIVQNAVQSKDHTTLMSLVRQAGLVETLEGPGPFAVVAPTSEAFAKLPKATVDKVTSDDVLLKKGAHLSRARGPRHAGRHRDADHRRQRHRPPQDARG